MVLVPSGTVTRSPRSVWVRPVTCLVRAEAAVLRRRESRSRAGPSLAAAPSQRSFMRSLPSCVERAPRIPAFEAIDSLCAAEGSGLGMPPPPPPPPKPAELDLRFDSRRIGLSSRLARSSSLSSLSSSSSVSLKLVSPSETLACLRVPAPLRSLRSIVRGVWRS